MRRKTSATPPRRADRGPVANKLRRLPPRGGGRSRKNRSFVTLHPSLGGPGWTSVLSGGALRCRSTRGAQAIGHIHRGTSVPGSAADPPGPDIDGISTGPGLLRELDTIRRRRVRVPSLRIGPRQHQPSPDNEVRPAKTGETACLNLRGRVRRALGDVPTLQDNGSGHYYSLANWEQGNPSRA